MAIIFKIFRLDEYTEFVAAGRTRGAPIYLTDGYIHLSTGEQVEETAAKHFANVDGLKLLGVNSEALANDLKWEVSRGAALFPHLYRELRDKDVLFVRDIPLVDGQHRFDGLLE